MVLTCANEATAKWVIDTAGNLKPWPGAQLSAVREEQIPKSQIVTAYLPNSAEEPVENILRLLGNQNQDIDERQWRILHLRKEKSTAIVTFSVDHKSMEIIRTRGNRLYYRFGEITIHPKGGKAKRTLGPGSENTAGDKVEEGRNTGELATSTVPQPETSEQFCQKEVAREEASRPKEGLNVKPAITIKGQKQEPKPGPSGLQEKMDETSPVSGFQPKKADLKAQQPKDHLPKLLGKPKARGGKASKTELHKELKLQQQRQQLPK